MRRIVIACVGALVSVSTCYAAFFMPQTALPAPPAFPVTSGQNLIVRAQDLPQVDNSSVSTWSDTSGNGYSLTPQSTAPKLGTTGGNTAAPFVYFSGEVIENTSYPVSKQACSFLIILDYQTVNAAKYTVTLGGGIVFVFMLDTGVMKRYNGGSGNFTQATPPTGRPIALLVTMGPGGTKLYLDGSTNVSTVSAESAGSITGFKISGAGALNAQVFEARGWNRELNSTEAGQILDTWAPAVYGSGAAAGTPTGRAVFDGDSITLGFGATKARNWPYFLNPTSGWLGYDYAITGETWANIIARQALTNTFANSTNWLFINGGTNDLGAGQTGAQIIANFQTYMTAAAAAGFTKPHMMATTLSTTNLGAGGIARNEYNTWLRANYATYAGFLFDIQLDTDLGTDSAGTKNNATYWIDGAHYTDAGYVLYAQKVRTLTGAPF